MADGSFPPAGPNPQNLLASMAAAYGGPLIGPTLQRSQMLAQALESMQQVGPTIKSPLALGSNLLAEALLQVSNSRNNAKLMQAIQGGQQAQLNPPDVEAAIAAASGAPGASVGPAAAAPPADYAAAPPHPPNPDLGAALSPPSSAPQSPQAHVLAALIAGGLSPTAASGLVGNFAQESGPNLALNNPGEGAVGMANWEGSRGQAAQRYFGQHGGPSLDNQAAFTLQELHGPESGALARLNAATDPTSAAAAGLAYERPAGYRPGGNPANASGWSNRAAQANAAYSAFQQSAAPQPGTASTSAGDQQAPAPRPFQISTGPDPSVASPGAQGPGGASPYPVTPQAAPTGSQAPAPAGPASPQAAGAGSPQFGQQGFSASPPGITQQQAAEWRQLQQLAQARPQIYMQPFQQLTQQLRERMTTPETMAPQFNRETGETQFIGAQSGRVYGTVRGDARAGPVMQPVGQHGYALVPGTGTSQLAPPAPGAISQQDMTGKITNEAVPNAVQSGQVWNPQTNSYQPLAGLQPQVTGGFAPGSVVSQAPGQAPSVVQAPQWGSQQVLQVRDSALKSDQYTNYTSSNDAWKSMVANASSQNGMSGYALRDTFARVINPGAVARVGTIQAIKESPGIPDQVKGMLLQLGPGGVPPQIVQQTLDAALPFAQANDHAARLLDQSNQSIIKGHGLNPGDVALPMDAPPQRFVVPQPHAAAPAGAVDANTAAAELQRRGYHLGPNGWTK